MLDPGHFEKMIEELIVIVREANFQARLRIYESAINPDPFRDKNFRPRLVSIFVSLESDPDGRLITFYEQKDSPADNVILFRNVTINDENRKTVEVRKSRGQPPDRQIREIINLKDDHFPVRVVPGLDNYRKILSGNPEPVRVALQLISENRTQEKCNHRLTERLRALFGYSVTRFGFSRGELIRTFLDIASGTDRIPFSDVKILHVDEWWIRELRVKAMAGPDRFLARTTHPLLRLNKFLACDASPNAVLAPIAETEARQYDNLPSDYWAVEMEKVCIPVLKDGGLKFQADIVGLPGYTDFGMFCVNAGLINRIENLQKENIPKWHDWLDKIPRVWAWLELKVEHDKASGQERNRTWWFKTPKSGLPTEGAETVVDFIRTYVKPDLWPDNPDEPIGFAFDMETPVTVSCTFLELAWAFGAPEDFFISDVGRFANKPPFSRFLEDHPATRALGFLMFLVAEGLMPARTSLRDTKRAVFTRLWYSSIPDVDPSTEPKLSSGNTDGPNSCSELHRPPTLGDETQKSREERIGNIEIYPLPFFPLGAYVPTTDLNSTPVPILICLKDSVLRFDRTLQRVESAAAFRLALIANSDAKTKNQIMDNLRDLRSKFENTVGTVDLWHRFDCDSGEMPGKCSLEQRERIATIVSVLEKAGEQLRVIVTHSPLFEYRQGFEQTSGPAIPGFDPEYPCKDQPQPPKHWLHLPYAMFLDLRDVLEVLRWHDFRLKSLRAALYGRPLGDLIRNPDAGIAAENKPRFHATTKHWLVDGISGFGCEGTWIVGVDRTTRSPNLSAKFLNEIASLESSRDRADLGAGIPTRKDFFEQNGHRVVPCLPHTGLTWNHLLTYVGSRANRRSRSFCARVRVSSAFDELDRRILHCLTVAELLRQEYRRSERESIRRAFLISRLTSTATEAMRGMFQWLQSEMTSKGQQDHTAWEQTQSNAQNETAKNDFRRPECVTCHTPHLCRNILPQIDP